MANEIIKLIEYITENPIVQGTVIGYIIFSAIVALLAIVVFVVVFWSIFKNKKR